MYSNKSQCNSNQISLFTGIIFLLVVIAAEFAGIMQLNNGFFVYTLDDAYIHLALAENIKNWHYGVNIGELSAPSSSILWPFIIAPFSSFEYFPLLINIVFSILTVFVFTKSLNLSFDTKGKWGRAILTSGVILLVLNTNLVGLVFTGMEHSLQVLLAVVIALGLIVEIEKSKVAPWFLAAIIMAPLIRYENIAISLAAIGYLCVEKYYKSTAIALLLLILSVCSFSIFLVLLGLDPFPASITVKSSVVESGGKLHSLIANLQESLSDSRGILLSLGGLGLLAFISFDKGSVKKRKLALVTICALGMHLVAGQYGWYNRYEIYIWAFLLLILFYLFGGKLAEFIEKKDQGNVAVKVLLVAVVFVMISGTRYIYSLFTLPVASSNIYEQQYQMHRFIVDYYKKPVAVNDLGYVSYKNNKYVLDLWGLASKDAFEYRQAAQGPGWMNQLAKSNDVEFAMIYEDWFKDIPDTWIKIGELTLGRKKITPARNTVVFYAMDEDAYAEVVVELKRFIKTLPPGVIFNLVEIPL